MDSMITQSADESRAKVSLVRLELPLAAGPLDGAERMAAHGMIFLCSSASIARSSCLRSAVQTSGTAAKTAKRPRTWSNGNRNMFRFARLFRVCMIPIRELAKMCDGWPPWRSTGSSGRPQSTLSPRLISGGCGFASNSGFASSTWTPRRLRLRRRLNMRRRPNRQHLQHRPNRCLHCPRRPWQRPAR